MAKYKVLSPFSYKGKRLSVGDETIMSKEAAQTYLNVDFLKEVHEQTEDVAPTTPAGRSGRKKK